MALLWGGLSLSAIGDQLYAVALTWIAVGVFGSNAGYLSALQALIVLMTVLGIGRWADGWDQRHSMVGADLARAAVLLGVVCVWLAAGAPSGWLLVAAIVVLALGQAVFQPALQAVLPSLVDDASLLPAANGLLDATDRSARLLGPGLVAVLAGAIPVVHFLTLDAASFVGSAGALLLIGRRHRANPAPRPARENIWRAMMRGVRAMRGHPLLGYVLMTTGWVNGAWIAVFFLALPLLIARHGLVGPGGSGLGAYGLVISAYGCTNLAATLVFGSRTLPRRPQFQMFGGTVLVGCGVLLLGLASLLPPKLMLAGLMAAAAAGAIGGPMKDIPLAVLRQTRLRPGDMAAAMRAYMAASSAGALAGMLLTPSVVMLAGVVPTILTCGLLLIATGVAGVLRHARWTEPAEVAA